MTFHSRLPDYYSLLGVGEDASFEDIRQAFRRRAKQLHPDRNKMPEAKQAFLVLSEAYYVLRDEERRETFDAFRGNEMLFEPPRPRVKPTRSQAWAAGVAFICLIGSAAFVLANVAPIGPISEREPGDGVRLASVVASVPNLVASPARASTSLVVAADNPSDKSEAPRPTPAVAKAADAPTPTVESWQATASRVEMPLVTAPDVLDDVPVAEKQPTRPVAAVPPQVAKPVPKLVAKRVAALVPRARAVTARQVRYARAYAAAQASKRWWAKKRQQRVMRRAVKRRYARN